VAFVLNLSLAQFALSPFESQIYYYIAQMSFNVTTVSLLLSFFGLCIKFLVLHQ